MIFLKGVFLAVCAFCFGTISSAGVFTVLVMVGLVPRFAGKFHIARKILLLEEMVVFGTIIGGFFSIFSRYGEIGDLVLSNQIFGVQTGAMWNVVGKGFCLIFGLFAGMFVGCLALAIAEMLNSIPIFARRGGFREGIGIVILMMSLGKLIGSLIYFSQGVFLHGGY